MNKDQNKRSSIGTRLVLAFASVGLLMLLGGVMALLQLNRMRQESEYLYQTDQPARAVLLVRSAFLGYQNELQQISAMRNEQQFEKESKRLFGSFQSVVEHATQAVRTLPPSAERDAELSSLETVHALLGGQIESLTALARAGDWNGVRLRIENRMPVINALSASLVHDIDVLVEIEQKDGLERIRRTQARAIWILATTSLLALLTAGFLGIKVTRNIAGRLAKLDEGARALTRGEFKHQVAVGGSDEIARLSEAFNVMASRLRTLYETLHESEAHFRALIENAKDYIAVLTVDGIVRYASPSMEKEFAKHGTLVGQNLLTMMEFEESHAVQRMLESSGGPDSPQRAVEFHLRGTSGAMLALEASASNLLKEPVIGGIVLNIRDVSERQRMEKQLLQAQRMEAIGTLSGGVAHDFNNLLTVIRGYTNQLLESKDLGIDGRKYAKRVDDAAERASTLTRQLLAFSRRQVLELKTFDVSKLVNNLEQMLRRLISEDIAMKTEISSEPAVVRADPGQIEQVIMNLVINARDAMPKGGKLTIETADVTMDESDTDGDGAVSAGRYVMIAVSDTGEGMDAKTKAQIFEPFFTTKGVGKGTGLGLSMVYGIVKQSGGHISVDSEVGKGSTFKVYLPQVQGEVEPPRKEDMPARKGRGKETVLLVEDEPQVRELISTVLSGLGYSVLLVEDPARAATVSEQHAGPIDLLVTDVILPGVSGRGVADQVVANRPSTKVLFISGYTPDAIVQHGVLDPGLHFLQKPFTMKGLASKVREVLES